MASESMTSDERVWAAVRLERPDRTPVIPTLLPEPAAGLAGVSQAEVANDNSAAIAATFTAVSHESLKFGFSWYATEVANYGSTLGNLATVGVLFFWIYYESLVFILGGEVAQVYTMRRASRVGVVSFRDGT